MELAVAKSRAPFCKGTARWMMPSTIDKAGRGSPHPEYSARDDSHWPSRGQENPERAELKLMNSTLNGAALTRRFSAVPGGEEGDHVRFGRTKPASPPTGWPVVHWEVSRDARLHGDYGGGGGHHAGGNDGGRSRAFLGGEHLPAFRKRNPITSSGSPRSITYKYFFTGRRPSLRKPMRGAFSRGLRHPG